MGNPVVSIGPIFRAGDLLSLRSHSRQRASVLPNTREWLLAPWRITEATRAILKLCPNDPAEPFAITFAPPREWLRVKDHVPPRTELHREGFKMFQTFRSNRRFMVSTSSPMSCGLRRNAFTPALRATASESVPDIITIGIHRR